MKKIIITVAILIGMTASAQLSQRAEFYRENSPEQYELVREFAIQEWPGDNKMIVYTINSQFEALGELITLSGGEFDNTISTFMGEWSKRLPDGREAYDWKMVLYEYKNHLENSDY